MRDYDIAYAVKDPLSKEVHCYEVLDKDGISLGWESLAYIQRYNIPVRDIKRNPL